MDNSKDSEYVFWLDFWRKSFAPWPKSGHFKCVVTKEKIHITVTDNDPDKELSIDIPSIRKCKLGYIGNNNRHVVLFLNGTGFLLGPVHPIDPTGIQNLNHNETSALIKVIEAFRSNTDPAIDTNPYLRQLAMKNNLKGFTVPNIKWDRHISPWDYYELYGDKFLRHKLFVKNMVLLIVIVPVVTLIILGIFYVLDTLNII